MQKAIEYFFILTTFAVATIIIQVQNPSYTFDTPSVHPQRHQLIQEPSVQEWVMNTIEAAGIDKYKVYDVIQCESGWNPDLMHENRKGMGEDRGLFQLSTKFHPEISNACSYDAKCSTQKAIEIIKQRGFQDWICARILHIK